MGMVGGMSKSRSVFIGWINWMNYFGTSGPLSSSSESWGRLTRMRSAVVSWS